MLFNAQALFCKEADWQSPFSLHFFKLKPHNVGSVLGLVIRECLLCWNEAGNRLLGRECDVLLFDARKEFDANSFTAAIGSLVGGGMLLVVTNTAQPQHFAEQWMQTNGKS